MAANLEMIGDRVSFAYASNILGRNWHKSGQMIEGESFTIEQARIAVPTAFMHVGLMPHFLSDGRQTGQTAVREDGAILGDVGPTQNIVQTHEFLRDGIGSLLPEGTELRLQSIGVLGNGERIFAQTPPVREIRFKNGKVWQARVAGTNCHDGTEAMGLMACMTDMVCANTVRAATIEAKQAGTSVRVKHTKGVRRNMERAADRLAAQLDSMAVLADAAQVALDTPLTAEEQQTILQSLWKADTRQADETRGRILQLSSGQDLVGAEEHNPGSAYGLYAAITQYLDTEASRRLSDAEKKNANQAALGTYLRSNLGMDKGLNTLRTQASAILLGV